MHHALRGIPDYPAFKVFAGVALNRGVGGINPGAVEIALDQGARIVWLPTFDAHAHVCAFGGTGEYGFKSMRLAFKGASRPHGDYSTLHEGKLTGHGHAGYLDIALLRVPCLKAPDGTAQQEYPRKELSGFADFHRPCGPRATVACSDDGLGF